jgi:flagellar basal body-associated protein FliL
MAEATAQHAAATESRTGLLGKPVFLGVILMVVMAAEAGVLLLFLPGPTADAQSEDGHSAADPEEPQAVEVMVDTFSTTNARAAPGTVIHVNFKLTAVVPSGQQMAFDHAANQEHNARVRQAVLKVCRNASLDDLNDPSLTSIRRQLREEINKVLRKSYVTEVVISDYKTMEQ